MALDSTQKREPPQQAGLDRRVLIVVGETAAEEMARLGFEALAIPSWEPTDETLDRIASAMSLRDEGFLLPSIDLCEDDYAKALALARALEPRGVIVRIAVAIAGEEHEGAVTAALAALDVPRWSEACLDLSTAARRAQFESLKNEGATIARAARLPLEQWSARGGTASHLEQALSLAVHAVAVDAVRFGRGISVDMRAAALRALLERVTRLPASEQTKILESIRRRTRIGVTALRSDLRDAKRRLRHAARAKPAATVPEALRFEEREGGWVVLHRRRGRLVEQPLTHFTAQIAAEIIEDLGDRIHRVFEIDAQIAGSVRRVRIDAEEFAAMRWVERDLGAAAVICAGMLQRDRVREAILRSSAHRHVRTAVRSVGWHRLPDGAWRFLDAGSACESIEVQLPAAARRWALGNGSTGEALRDDVACVLGLLELASDRVMVPLLGCALRAPLGPCDLALSLEGSQVDVRKALAALVIACFAPGLEPSHLPLSPETVSALKDVPIAFDGAARVPTFRLSTVGRGADALSLDLARQAPDPVALAAAQSAASRGQLARAMAAYVAWLAPQIESVLHELGNRVGASHRPVPCAHLEAGWSEFLRFAQDVGALPKAAAATTWSRVCAALSAIPSAANVARPEPDLERACALERALRQCLHDGRAHLASATEEAPGHDPRIWGWERNAQGDWQPRGARIGWIAADEGIWLLPHASYAVLQQAETESLPIQRNQVGRTFARARWLQSRNPGRRRHVVLRRIGGVNYSVLHLRREFLSESAFAADPKGLSAHASR
ncbi:MAG: hypothetical protein JNJ88_03700 [Planctomycetes bacterium]|nr:hypothetical protein [Planctomycetota bacterium]